MLLGDSSSVPCQASEALWVCGDMVQTVSQQVSLTASRGSKRVAVAGTAGAAGWVQPAAERWYTLWAASGRTASGVLGTSWQQQQRGVPGALQHPLLHQGRAASRLEGLLGLSDDGDDDDGDDVCGKGCGREVADAAAATAAALAALI